MIATRAGIGMFRQRPSRNDARAAADGPIDVRRRARRDTPDELAGGRVANVEPGPIGGLDRAPVDEHPEVWAISMTMRVASWE